MKKMVDFDVTPDSQFAVLGLGQFGYSIAKELAAHGRNVFCCDKNERPVREAAAHIRHVVQADASGEEFLDKIGISNFDVVIIAFSGNFEDAILTTMKVKEKGVPFIIAKATDERHKRVLESVGADYVLLPNIVMGERLAHSLIHNDPLMKINESDKFEIMEISPKEKWLNKKLEELQLTRKENISILGILRDDRLVERITKDVVLLEDDILIVMKTVV